MKTGTILDAAATGDTARAALIIDGRTIGYGDLAATVRQCAARLAARGVVAGQRVAVVDNGSLLSIATLLGAARIGAAGIVEREVWHGIRLLRSLVQAETASCSCSW